MPREVVKMASRAGHYKADWNRKNPALSWILIRAACAVPEGTSWFKTPSPGGSKAIALWTLQPVRETSSNKKA
jgi:hypothetical protein